MILKSDWVLIAMTVAVWLAVAVGAFAVSEGDFSHPSPVYFQGVTFTYSGFTDMETYGIWDYTGGGRTLRNLHAIDGYPDQSYSWMDGEDPQPTGDGWMDYSDNDFPEGVTLTPPEGGGGTNDHYWVSAMTNGSWEAVLTNAIELSERMRRILEAVEGMATNTYGMSTNSIRDLLSYGEYGVFKDNAGTSWGQTVWDKFYMNTAFDSDRFMVAVDWDKYPGGTNGGGGNGGDWTGSWTNIFSGMGTQGWFTAVQGDEFFKAGEKSVFKDESGYSVFKTDDGQSLFKTAAGGSVLRDNRGMSAIMDDSDRSVFKDSVGGSVFFQSDGYAWYQDANGNNMYRDADGNSVFTDADRVSWLARIHQASTNNSQVLSWLDKIYSAITNLSFSQAATTNIAAGDYSSGTNGWVEADDVETNLVYDDSAEVAAADAYGYAITNMYEAVTQEMEVAVAALSSSWARVKEVMDMTNTLGNAQSYIPATSSTVATITLDLGSTLYGAELPRYVDFTWDEDWVGPASVVGYGLSLLIAVAAFVVGSRIITES